MTPDSSSSSVDDPLFESGHRIFANKDLLKIGHVPEADRIVGRDEEIRSSRNVSTVLSTGTPRRT